MKKVFFVDDEPLIAQGLSSITDWQHYGIQITGSANDGETALQRIKEEPVDLVITDIMMPRMNGLELIKRVKEIHPRTRFIVLSGYEEFEYVKVGITLGIENYILKPINIDELESTIRHIRGDWEREKLNMFRYEEDWRVLQSNILQRWVLGEIEVQEFKHRAELLGIPLNYKYVQTLVFHIVSEEKSISRLHRPNGLSEECGAIARAAVETEDEVEVICFPDGDEDLVVLYVSDHLEHQEAVLENASVTAERISKMTDLPVWAVRGVISSDFQGVQHSYRQAKMVFQRYLITGQDKTVFMESILPEEEESSTAVWDQEAYIRLLIEGKQEAVVEFIESILPDLFKSSRIPRSTCLNTAIGLMLSAKDLEDRPDYSEVFAQLARINTLCGLIQHVVSVVQRSMNNREETIQHEYSGHVADLIEQVKEHYAEELSLKTISQKLDMHPNYLGQLFQQEVGLSFSDYVNHYRIEKATQLLIHTDQKTTEIAADVGYIDTSYFYRQFKKYAGVSPTELRHMYTK
ncbi:DNA-binding response regulator [Paenibacillus selenitireducens]|uniref:DNA-binding response regulator n=1 Tax=Paenibacillus selenitireducens TaxID=1324314 RepID=A0A1T2XL12_9BACL|nr:response regulator transcription factor [Paenibacillus selenitireducens]OPA80561.1 DNA-binding response regulator [Paenibacillus selenitireducens]